MKRLRRLFTPVHAVASRDGRLTLRAFWRPVLTLDSMHDLAGFVGVQRRRTHLQLHVIRECLWDCGHSQQPLLTMVWPYTGPLLRGDETVGLPPNTDHLFVEHLIERQRAAYIRTLSLDMSNWSPIGRLGLDHDAVPQIVDALVSARAEAVAQERCMELRVRGRVALWLRDPIVRAVTASADGKSAELSTSGRRGFPPIMRIRPVDCGLPDVSTAAFVEMLADAAKPFMKPLTPKQPWTPSKSKCGFIGMA